MIVFKSVYKTFDPDESGVKDISFHVKPGELVMVTGHSGSGKTTLMRLLTKEYTPNKGDIEFDGENLSKIKRSRLHEHRRKIGVVFQDYRLVPEMNVWENIALPLSILGKTQDEIEERVTDLLNLVQLTQKAHLFPSQLSGGEAQRISIARALAIAPSVIFADEPTGNLDQDTSLSIAQLLKQINELGTTFIFATHDPKVLSVFADKRHLHLKEGALAFDTAEKASEKSKKKASKEDTEEKTDTSAEELDEKVETKKPDSSQEDTDKESERDEESVEADSKDLEEKQKKTRATGFWSRFFKPKEATKSIETTPENDEMDEDTEKEGDTASEEDSKETADSSQEETNSEDTKEPKEAKKTKKTRKKKVPKKKKA